MKDEMTESMKSYYHPQRIPSLSPRDKEMALLSRAPAEDGEDHECPSMNHLHKHFLREGRAGDAHWSSLSANALGTRSSASAPSS